jgi:acetyl-CoA acetyltransferase
MKANDRVAAVGVGYSTTGRRTGLTSWQLGIQAAKAALADAGMTPKDVDGVSILWGVAGPAPAGLDQVNAMDFGYALGMSPLNFYGNPSESPAYAGAAIQAISAIRSGMAETVMTIRIINQRMSSTEEIAATSGVEPTWARGDTQFTQPFGEVSPVFGIAGIPTQRYMSVYGATEEQFGAHVVAQRHHATMNDDALFRDPLTMEDYLNSRYICKPVHLLDCDYPVDSASAIIYTSGERAVDWQQRPVFVESAAHSSIKYNTLDNLDDINHTSPFHCAEKLWSRTDLRPEDVDCAQLYDGFTIIVMTWLEALGFCGTGEAATFVSEGNTRLGGRIPVNTDGGACNVGRRHGANFCIESIRQLRGQSGDRQVPDAEVAVWTNAVGPFSGAVLMTAS